MIIDVLNTLVVLYFLVLTGVYLSLFAAAAMGVRRTRQELEGAAPESVQLRGRATLPISVIVPAYNEEKNVVESVRALLALRYPEHEVVVVNDGSSDNTLAELRRAFALEPVPVDLRLDLECQPVRATYRSAVNRRLIVVDKENGGKADALNCAINAARYPLVCAIDADTVIVPDALLRLVRPFLSDLDVVGAGGSIVAANGCVIEDGNVTEVGLPHSWLARFQVVEYLRAFLVGRLGWDGLGGNLIISGAFGLFRRGAMVKAGGYADDTVGEDMELVARLRHDVPQWLQPRAIRHVPDAVAFTEVPEDLRVLGRQRDRWQRGLLDTLWRHKRMTFNPRYGAVGTFVTPFFWAFEAIAPLIEFFGFIWVTLLVFFGEVSPLAGGLFFLVALMAGMMLSLGSIMLEQYSLSFFREPGDIRRLLTFAFLENWGFRQLMVWYRLLGTLSFFRGRRAWGQMTRTGFGAAIAGTGARARQWLPALVVLLFLFILSLPVAWFVKRPPESHVLVLNKTVPFENYREHGRLMWLLSHFKAPPPSGRLQWNVREDYIGYDPALEETHDLTEEDLAGKSILYVADTYGVYVDDFDVEKGALEDRVRVDTALEERVEHIELSRKIYGGLQIDEVAAIEKFVRGGGRLVAEFNAFATPTARPVRERMERLLNVEWTGWAVRPIVDFADPFEVAEWIRDRWCELNRREKWDIEGPGLLFVHESSLVVALREGVELKPNPVHVRTDSLDIPYPYWSDIVTAVNDSDVRAEFHIRVKPAGAALLDAWGIPAIYPAVTHNDALTRTYLAGDFSDGPWALGPVWLAGLAKMRKGLARLDVVPPDTRLMWTIYAPLIERILALDDEENRRSGRLGARAAAERTPSDQAKEPAPSTDEASGPSVE